jgi:small-conductance mechanosensitive channel
MFLLGSAAPGVGQAQEAEPAAEAAPAKGADLVPPDQIPARATSARVTLDSIRARLPAAAETGDARLEDLGAAVDHLRQKSDLSRLERLPEFRIAELQRQVRFHQRELAKLESRDVARATRLSADAAELSRLRAQWEATLARAEEDRLSRPLLEEARGLLQQIDETDKQLEGPLAAALAGRERVSRFEARLEMLVRTLDDASRRAQARRLVRDVPPIWAPGALEISPSRDWESAAARIRDQVQYSRDYFQARRAVLEVLAVCAGLSLLLVLWLRRRGEWFRSADAQSADASRVLKRPFSSLLLVFLAAALLLSEFAPTIVLEALAVATMLVLLRLMPGRLVAGHGYLLVGLAAIFALDRARSLMPFESVAFRLDQLLVAGGLAAGYALALRLKKRGEVPPRSWLALMAFVAPIALVLTAAAVVSSLLGNISLADLLVHGTLTSAYVSAVLFAAVFIIDDFTWMLVRSRAGQHLRMITLRGTEIAQTTQRVLRTLALLAWVYITLAGFQIIEPVEARVREWLSAEWAFGELSFTLGGIATFVIGVLVAVYASRMVRFLLNEEVLSRVAWPPGAKSTTATLAYYGVLFAGLLLALSAAGIETSQFALIVGALGVGIGFGLQNVVNNFVSGLILMFERPIQPGDIIDVDTLQGRVIEIGLRATRVQTWEGAEVIVPNGTMLSGNLINWTLSDTSRRVEIPVGVAYGTSVRRVLDLLTKVAQQQPDAMSDPQPVVLFTGFGESSLDFSVRFWTRDAATAVVARSEAGAAISEALEAEGIEIPFPQRDLHLRSVSPEATQSLRP